MVELASGESVSETARSSSLSIKTSIILGKGRLDQLDDLVPSPAGDAYSDEGLRLLYPHLPIQLQLRQQFGQLVHDEAPIVRRQAATSLAKLVKKMRASIAVEEMISMFQHLAHDDQDSARLLIVAELEGPGGQIRKMSAYTGAYLLPHRAWGSGSLRLTLRRPHFLMHDDEIGYKAELPGACVNVSGKRVELTDTNGTKRTVKCHDGIAKVLHPRQAAVA